jgi:tetrahydromethanopterin S-methyltransferase subunit C
MKKVIFSNEMKKRLASFAWRTGGMVLAYALAAIAENLSIFELPVWATTVIGLVIGEITKAINNRLKK